MFCMNIDIDEMLLLEKNKGLGINSFRGFSLGYYTPSKGSIGGILFLSFS